jgi:hypothetical protein
MGAETQNQRLAGSAAARMRSAQASREGVAQRQKAIEMAEKAPQGGNAPLPPGLEEAYFRRSELTRERDRTGRREEIFRDLQRGAGESASVTPGGAVERGATAFGAPFGGAGQGPNAGAGLRSGIAFGPGRSTRMPEVGSPEYQQLLQRVRGLQNR